MKRYNQIAAALLAVAIAGLAVVATAGSHYSSHAYLAAVNVGPGNGARSLEFLSAYTTTEGAYVELQAGKPTVYSVATAQSSAVTNFTLNSVTGLTANDTVIIVHATGAVDYRTVAGVVSATALCTLTAAPSAALTTAARMWELETQGKYYLPFLYSGTNTETKVTAPLQLSGKLYTGYGVPIRLQLSGTNCVISATTGD